MFDTAVMRYRRRESVKRASTARTFFGVLGAPDEGSTRTRPRESVSSLLKHLEGPQRARVLFCQCSHRQRFRTMLYVSGNSFAKRV
jgi:hypothetical protein